VKAGQPLGPKITGEGEIMTQYLVAIHHRDDYDPSVETEAISSDIHALNREMVAAGVRISVIALRQSLASSNLASHIPKIQKSSPTLSPARIIFPQPWSLAASIA
jgi:hypothetical protein